MKKVKYPYFAGHFWISKRGNIYIASQNWFKAIIGIASPSIMSFFSQKDLMELFDGKYDY